MKLEQYFILGCLLLMMESCEPERVAQAREEKLALLQAAMQTIGVNASVPFEVFFRAFKNEKQLEVWVKQQPDTIFQLFKTYPICQASGSLGPKLKQGDKQVPEGFYVINRFNPKSTFHLSLGLNYPNESDLVRADSVQPGGDIFIHGDCVSIGCLAMTDGYIKEIYVLALLAKEAGQQQINVHIFPARLTNGNLDNLIADKPDLAEFWKELFPVFQYFELKKMLPELTVLPTGAYQLIKDES